MADMHRRTPEPPQGPPRVEHRPGMADELLRELAPLLAEDGIDLGDPDQVPDLQTLQAAMQRAAPTAVVPPATVGDHLMTQDQQGCIASPNR